MTLLAIGVALAVAVTFAGCEIPPPQSAPTDPCRWEGAAVEALGGAVGALEQLAPESDEMTRAIALSLESLELGRASVAICHMASASERPRWWAWAAGGLRALSAILGIIKEAGVPIPSALQTGLAVISTALSMMSPPSPPSPG